MVAGGRWQIWEDAEPQGRTILGAWGGEGRHTAERPDSGGHLLSLPTQGSGCQGGLLNKIPSAEKYN